MVDLGSRCPLNSIPIQALIYPVKKPSLPTKYIIFYIKNSGLIACIGTACQTAPLRESHIAFREGPKKNEGRASLALYFYKAACRHSTLIATPRLKIATNMVANELTIYNATVSFLVS